MIRAFAILLLIFINKIQAQDVHFSQFSKTKSLLNPSLITSQDNDYHVHLQRRSQWSSVTEPFKTLSLSFIAKKVYKEISLGAAFLNDIAGDSHLSTNGLNFSVANSFNLKENSFSLGLLIGTHQRSIDFGGLIFLEEENIRNTNFTFFDIGVGISNYREIDRNSSFLVGIATYHLNKPNQSLTASNRVFLQPKSIIHSTYNKVITSRIKISPTFYLSSQKKERELMIGSEASYKLTSLVDLKSGVYARMNDAIVILFGFYNQNLEVLLSYDINTSSLSNASNNMGGFEFSVNYGWSILKKKEEKEQIVCPKYL